MFKFFHRFRSSQLSHYTLVLFLFLLLSIGPVFGQEVTPEPQPPPSETPTDTPSPSPTNTATATTTEPPLTATLTTTPTITLSQTISPETTEITLPPTTTPSPSSTVDVSSTPTSEMTVTATPTPIPTETPFVPSPVPFDNGDLRQPSQQQPFSLFSSLPVLTIDLLPGSSTAELIDALVDANPSPCTNHTVITLPANEVYTLTATHNSFFGGTGLPVIRCEVTINGTQTQIIRDPSLDTAIPPDYFRIFGVEATGILRLNGIEVRNGHATSTGGGGILNVFGGQVYLNNTVIENNVANQTGSPQTLGAGIYSYEGALYIENSRIANNLNTSVVGDGGGIGVINAITSITGTEIVDNSTTRDGGGVALLFTGTPSVNTSCIIGNDRINTSGSPLSSNGLFANRGATNAQNNWWGASNGPSGIGGGSGDAVLGVGIGFVPYAASPLNCGPQPVTCDVTVNTLNTLSNVRNQPSGSGALIGQLEFGQQFTVSAQNSDGTWYQFFFADTEHWIASSLVDPVIPGACASLPLPYSSPPTPSPNPDGPYCLLALMPASAITYCIDFVIRGVQPVYDEFVITFGGQPDLDVLVGITMEDEWWAIRDQKGGNIKNYGMEGLSRNYFEFCDTDDCSPLETLWFLSGYQPWLVFGSTPQIVANERYQVYLNEVSGPLSNPTSEFAQAVTTILFPTDPDWQNGRSGNRVWQWFNQDTSLTRPNEGIDPCVEVLLRYIPDIFEMYTVNQDNALKDPTLCP